MKTTSLIFLLCVLITGCQKSKTEYINISGYLYVDCSQVPITYTQVELFQTNGGSIQGGKVIATASTDLNGYFTMKVPQGADDFILRKQSSVGVTEIMYRIPADKNIENLKTYIHPKSILKVHLNVINPRSSSDTLTIANFNTMQDLKIVGPFSSGVLYTAVNFQPLGMYFNGEDKRLLWYFNTYHGTYFEKYFKIDKYCVSDTIHIVADIQ